MTRGRKPNPSALNRLRGNPGKRGVNHEEPKYEARAPSAPKHLDSVAKKEWRRAVKLLQEARVMTEVDLAVLAAYCRAWSLYVEADGEVQRYGSVLISPKTGAPYQSPYLNQMTAAMKDMVRFAAELGMTPSSRSRVKSAGAGAEADPLGQLITNFYAGRQNTN